MPWLQSVADSRLLQLGSAAQKCSRKPHKLKHLRTMAEGNSDDRHFLSFRKMSPTPVLKRSKKSKGRNVAAFALKEFLAYCNSILLTVMFSSFTVPVTLTLMSLVFFTSLMNCLALALLAASNLMIFLSSVSTP